MDKTIKLAAVTLAAGALLTMPSALTAHDFQLKNCNSYENTWFYDVYDPDDSVEVVPFMSINFTSVGQIKDGKCHGDGDGYCKVFNEEMQKNFHVQTAKTVFGDAGHISEYDGLLDCNSEPSASAPSTSKK